jgi:hypothetical protein
MRTINFHLERVVIDEAVHRAGPEAIKAALAAQLPALLAEYGLTQPKDGGAAVASGVAARLSSPAAPPPRAP